MNMKSKYRVTSRARFITFFTIIIIAVILIFSATTGLFTAQGDTRAIYTTIEVSDGDTLWSIAQQYGSDKMDTRDFIAEICELNEIDAGSLQAGSTLMVPIVD